MTYHPERQRAPPCKEGKRHAWKKGALLTTCSGICGRCGWDSYDKVYWKDVPQEGDNREEGK